MKPWWANASGWEYDLVRLLPDDQASKICQQAWQRWYWEVFLTWKGGILLFLISLPLAISLVAIWTLTAAMGGGAMSRIVAELIVHGFLIYPYHLLLLRLMIPYVRPYVRAELFDLIQEDLSPEIAATWQDALANHPEMLIHTETTP